MTLLKPGDSGIYVEYLSLALERAGFFAGGITSEFDGKVYNAVIAFQNANNLSADGVVGEITQTALLPYLKGYIEVTAKEGDTVFSLANIFPGSPEAIFTANPYLSTSSIPAGAVVTVPFGFDVVATNVAPSYFLTCLTLDGLKARYPFVNLGSAGKSIMGRELWYMSIGEGETQVFANASHHANECITTPVLLKYAEDFLKAVASRETFEGANAAEISASKKLVLMPLVNPDGVDLVTGALTSDNAYYLFARSIAAEYSSIPFPNGWKANIDGTDLNLNYPAGWQNAREIKGAQGFVSPAPRDFVGTAPLSAPESRAVYNFTLNNNFALTLSYHTQGGVIYWKYLNYLPKNAEEIGFELSSASGYELETTPYASGFAGYKDWYISFYNRPGYTIEAGNGQNPLPISDFNSIYPPNRRLIAKAVELAPPFSSPTDMPQ